MHGQARRTPGHATPLLAVLAAFLAGLRKDAPAHLIHALHRALAKEPEERYGTMEEFATAVLPSHPVTAGTASSASLISSGGSLEAATEITSAPPPKKRRRGRSLALVAVIIAAGAGGTYWVTGGQAESQATGGDDPAAVAAAMTGDSSAGQAPPETTTVRDTGTTQVQQPPVQQEPVVQDPPRDEGRRQQERPVEQPRQQTPLVGWVFVNATPYGTVWINGIEIGDTPLVRHELRPGAYVVEIRREGYRTAVDTVQVTRGNVSRHSYTLIREQ